VLPRKQRHRISRDVYFGYSKETIFFTQQFCSIALGHLSHRKRCPYMLPDFFVGRVRKLLACHLFFEGKKGI